MAKIRGDPRVHLRFLPCTLEKISDAKLWDI